MSLAVNGLFFMYAARKKADIVTDLSYSLSFAQKSAFRRPCFGGASSCS